MNVDERINSRKRARARKKRLARRRIALTILSLCISLIISLGFFGGQAKAASDNTITVYKYYKSVYVSKEDTLWSYAEQYAPNDNYTKYINEVKTMNGLGSDDISVGMCLVIPYYSTVFK